MKYMNISPEGRVREELRMAGMSEYGLRKSSTRYLHNLIHQNEHIGAVVYGRYQGGSGMLVATDHRIIFLDHKPLFTSSDEIRYDVVFGVRISSAGPFATITLHTRVGEYELRYVNRILAEGFAEYIEEKIMDEVPRHLSNQM